ncbi:MAG: glycosyltransferase family 9 protein [Alphaproteobacteria bacterium]
MSTPQRLLVIKLGALGDFVQATGPFAAIRDHHPKAHITLLTTRPFVDFAAASPWFDDIWCDNRPPPWHLLGWWHVIGQLASAHFDWVYDLQTSDRTATYYRLMRWPLRAGPPPCWSGIARGCSHPHANPNRDNMHTLKRQAEQLAMAGITRVPPPTLHWVTGDIAGFDLTSPYALLVPGGAPTRPRKRWPAQAYAALAGSLAARGITPVLLGTQAEAAENQAIAAACPQARDLTGQTGLADIVVLARSAAGAVGNDTGPMHVIALAGAPCLVLFSDASDPALCAPIGDDVAILSAQDLAQLSLAKVEAHLRLR